METRNRCVADEAAQEKLGAKLMIHEKGRSARYKRDISHVEDPSDSDAMGEQALSSLLCEQIFFTAPNVHQKSDASLVFVNTFLLQKAWTDLALRRLL